MPQPSLALLPSSLDRWSETGAGGMCARGSAGGGVKWRAIGCGQKDNVRRLSSYIQWSGYIILVLTFA